jgi:hypothetical protein
MDGHEADRCVVDLKGQADGSFIRGGGHDEVCAVGEVVGGGLRHANEALVDVRSLDEDCQGNEAVEPESRVAAADLAGMDLELARATKVRVHATPELLQAETLLHADDVDVMPIKEPATNIF